MRLKTTKRLIQIYTLAQGDALWDIGCDHSLLALMNLREKKFSKVYCVDRSKSSLEKINQKIRVIDPLRIEVIQSDGCLLNWEDVSGTVVIAGSCPEKYRKRLTWVLNPFTSVDKFLKEIVQFLPETVMERYETKENGRVRQIFKYPATE
ncbi:MAG: hypothetical protein B7Y39_11295 [Bdellovibrio sp. 28-41-41]|nr:MAG: hypothetical protein B7Y39_11295 [Bdellovibrio sp. 28-41-41]